jgi:hypothetical protein
VSQSNYFDDLYVAATIPYVADFQGGAIRAYGLDGTVRGVTPLKLIANPSSVLPAQGRFGLGESDLVVTDKSANRVSVVHPCASH